MSYNPLNPNGQTTSANSSPVVVASDQSAVPVSASSLPLPAGAATSVNQTNASQKTQVVDGSGNVIGSTSNALDVNIKSGGSSGVSATDEATWTAGSSTFAPVGGAFNDSAAALTSGQQGTVRLTNNRGLHSNLRSAAGTEIATSSNPLRVDPTGTTIQPVSGMVTANAGMNLNTSNLALDSSVTGLQVSQGSTTSGQKGDLVQGAVTTSAPSYTTAQTSPLSLDTSGNLRTSVNNTVTVSGTVTTSPPSNASVNLNQVAGSSVATAGTGIAKVGLTDGSGNVINSTSNALNVSVSGTPTVTANAGTNLNTSALALESGGNLATLAGTVASSKVNANVSQATAANLNATVVGQATGSTAPSTAFEAGTIAATSLPAAVSNGQLVGTMGDKFGRPVVLTNSIRDLVGSQTTTISASTAETTIVSQAASVFNDLSTIIVSNTSTTATRVDFRDTTGGSVIFQLYVPASDTRGVAFTTPLPQTSVNTNWTATCITSITDLRITVQFIKNK